MSLLIKSAIATTFIIMTSSLVMAQGIPPPQGNNQNNQAGNFQDRNNAVNLSIFGRVTQTPWFMDQATRTQLRINEEQAKRLNQSYAQFWNVYNRNTEPYNSSFNLTEAQRQNMLTASNQFYLGFGRNANDILTPEQRVRFFQLGNQYRGYSTFYDPTISERLRLSNDQLAQIRRYENDYNTQLAAYYKARAVDPTNAATQFNELRKDMNQRITSVLTAKQREAWKEITGDPYIFRIQ